LPWGFVSRWSPGWGDGRGPHGVVTGADHAAVRGDGDGRNAHVVLGNELVAALVLAKIPDAHVAAAVTANELALVRVDDYIVDGDAVGVVALDVAAARVPDLDGAVFGRGDQPLGLAVKGDARDVGRVAVEGQDRVRVRRLDVVELDRVVARGGEVALVGRDAQAVDLRVGVGDGAGADAAEGLPEALGELSARWQREKSRVSVYRIVWS
jgi:hypothetical protein